jgi:hypothetical protein
MFQKKVFSMRVQFYRLFMLCTFFERVSLSLSLIVWDTIEAVPRKAP